MDFRHLIVTCLFSKLRLPFDNQKVKENYAIFIKNGLENGFKDKELNKTGCMSIIATIVGLLVLVSMCSH